MSATQQQIRTLVLLSLIAPVLWFNYLALGRVSLHHIASPSFSRATSQLEVTERHSKVISRVFNLFATALCLRKFNCCLVVYRVAQCFITWLGAARSMRQMSS